MPRLLCLRFEETRAYPGVQNQYPDGSSQRASHAVNSARAFQLTARDIDGDLLDFFNQTGHQPFYFYFWREGAHDPTGASSTGRYICVFEGNYTETLGMASEEAQVTIRHVE